jgi:hypothetical protein
MTKVAIAPGDYAGLHKEVVSVVESARRTAARNVNAVMTAAYWEIGRRIVASEQGGHARAGYGQALIARLADDLTRRFGRGFGKANLASMRAFYLAWPAAEIFQTVSGKSAVPENVQTPSGKSLPAKDVVDATATAPDYMALATRFTLPWSAYVRLLSVKTVAARVFYETEALREGWSVRQLDRQISSQLYERLALSRNKAALLRKAADVQPGDLLTPEEAIRDPFVLEFLDIKDEYSESDLEEALIQHLADSKGRSLQLCGRRADASLSELRARALDEARGKSTCRPDSLRPERCGRSTLRAGQPAEQDSRGGIPDGVAR